MAFFSASVTARGRSRFDTHASDESISPGVRAGSGTVQDLLDLLTLALRQCCPDAKLVKANKLKTVRSRIAEPRILSDGRESGTLDFTPWRAIPHKSTIRSEYRRPEKTLYSTRRQHAKGSEALRRKFRFSGQRLSQIQCEYPAPLDQKREGFAQAARTGDRADIW